MYGCGFCVQLPHRLGTLLYFYKSGSRFFRWFCCSMDQNIFRYWQTVRLIGRCNQFSGLLPGAVVYFMILQIMERNSNASLPTVYLIAYSAVAFLITLFAALRLAKFNVDERQSDGFIGLATPAATIFVWGVLEVFLHNTFGLGFIVQSVPFLYAVTALLSVFMIAELPMFAFKFKHYGWSGNEIRYLFIILSVVLLAVFNFASLSIIIILYILISIAQKFIKS